MKYLFSDLFSSLISILIILILIMHSHKLESFLTKNTVVFISAIIEKLFQTSSL